MRACKSCMFFSATKDPQTDEWVFECRRYAPYHLSGVGTGYEEKRWAIMKPDDWCGEHILEPTFSDTRKNV